LRVEREIRSKRMLRPPQPPIKERSMGAPDQLPRMTKQVNHMGMRIGGYVAKLAAIVVNFDLIVLHHVNPGFLLGW